MIPSYLAVYTRLSSYLKEARSASGDRTKRRKRGRGIRPRCELRPTAEQQALVAGWL